MKVYIHVLSFRFLEVADTVHSFIVIAERNRYAVIDKIVFDSAAKVTFIRNVFFRLRQILPSVIYLQTALIEFENQVALVRSLL